MTQGSRSRILLAAGIVGAAAIVGSLILAQSFGEAPQQIDRAARETESVGAAVGSANEVLAKPNTAPVPAAGQQPEPNRRYTVNIEGAPFVGPENAEVTLIEFSDFQCSFCAEFGPTLEQIREEYGNKVRIVFKHLPLSSHAKAPAAHAAAEAAFRQGKFWEMHDRIFANQQEMAPEKYREYAAELGLDVAQFELDVESAEVKGRIDVDANEAARLGVTATPSFYINGRHVRGALPFVSFKKAIDEELAPVSRQPRSAQLDQ
jgi:protein-disulfide isomerase